MAKVHGPNYVEFNLTWRKKTDAISDKVMDI